MVIQRLLCVVLLVGLLLACGPDEQPVVTNSGIEGRVSIGPVCPASQQGTPCPDDPYQATLIVRDASSGNEVASVRSASDGTFRVELEPGEYVVEPQPTNPVVPPYAEPQTVTVKPEQFTKLDILYDSGVR